MYKHIYTNVQTMYKHTNISNHLISVKENSSFQEAGYISQAKIIDNGVLNPIEYLLSTILNTSVKIRRESEISKIDDNF